VGVKGDRASKDKMLLGVVIIRERMVSRGRRERLIDSIIIVLESRSKMRRMTERREGLPLCLLECT
jgi:hypothetical protein